MPRLLISSSMDWIAGNCKMLSEKAQQQLIDQLAVALDAADADIDELERNINSGAKRSNIAMPNRNKRGGTMRCIEEWRKASLERVAEQWRSDISSMISLITSIWLPSDNSVSSERYINEATLWLSDRHSGRSVSKFVSSRGKTYICKFRQAHGEIILSEYSRILNTLGIESTFSIPAWIGNGSGTIHDFVEEFQVAQQEILYSLGRFLAQIFFIRGTDFHFENLRLTATGKFAIIDAETILCPSTEELSSYSINDTGIPPYFMAVTSKKSIDFGFLTTFSQDGVFNRGEINNFCKGFECEIDILIKNADQIYFEMQKFLLSNPLSVRMVLRPTQFYSQLLRLSKYSKIAGSFNSSAFNTLQEIRNLGFNHLASETAALLSGDIPKFEVDVANGNVTSEGVLVGKVPSPLATWRKFLLGVTRGKARYAQILREHSYAAYGIVAKGSRDEPIAPDAVAHRIAEKFLDSYCRDSMLGHWHSTVPAPEDRYSIRTDDFSLYSGWAGVAMFLYAYGTAFLHAESHRAALEICNVLCQKGARRGGIAAGAVGSLYAIGIVSRLAKQNIAPTTSSTLIETSVSLDWAGANSLDLLTGLPGVVGVLCSLPSSFHSRDGVFPAIERLGNTLVNLSGKADRLPKITGISHGLAGVSLALTQYMKFNKNPSIPELIERIWLAENSLYQKDGWPDLRTPRPYRSLHQWCHGSVGIGTSRLAAVDIGNIPGRTALKDLEIAIKNTIHSSPNGRLGYCCGEVGRIDFLIECSRSLNRPDLLRMATQRWTSALSSSPELAIFPKSLALNVGFFNGFSGVGWVALRLLFPEKFPFVGGLQ